MKKIYIGLLLLLLGSVRADTLNFRDAYYSETPDSMRFVKAYSNGVLIDSSYGFPPRTTANYDTAIYRVLDSAYNLYVDAYWAGEVNKQRLTYYVPRILPPVNVKQVSYSDSTADNLQAAYEQANAWGPMLHLGQIDIETADSTQPALRVTSSRNDAVLFKSTADSYRAFYVYGDSGAYGLRMEAGGVADSGAKQAFYVIANDTASTFKVVNTGGGVALDIRTDSATGGKSHAVNDAMQLVAGGNTLGNYGLEIEGKTYMHGRDAAAGGGLEQALLLLSNAGIAFTAQSSNGALVISISGNDGSPSQLDTVVKVTGGSVVQQFRPVARGDSSAVLGDSAAFQGAAGALDSATIDNIVLSMLPNQQGTGQWDGGTGSGAYLREFVVYDSTISQTIQKFSVDFYNTSLSTRLASIKSNVNGKDTASLDPGWVVFVSNMPGWILVDEGDSIQISAAFGIDTIFVDQFDPGAPSGSFLCNTWGNVFSVDGSPLVDVMLRFTMPRQGGNSCDSTGIIIRTAVSAPTDSTGRFMQALTWSSCLGNEAYSVTLLFQDGREPIRGKTVLVPDSSSYKMTFVPR